MPSVSGERWVRVVKKTGVATELEGVIRETDSSTHLILIHVHESSVETTKVIPILV